MSSSKSMLKTVNTLVMQDKIIWYNTLIQDQEDLIKDFEKNRNGPDDHITDMSVEMCNSIIQEYNQKIKECKLKIELLSWS